MRFCYLFPFLILLSGCSNSCHEVLGLSSPSPPGFAFATTPENCLSQRNDKFWVEADNETGLPFTNYFVHVPDTHEFLANNVTNGATQISTNDIRAEIRNGELVFVDTPIRPTTTAKRVCPKNQPGSSEMCILEGPRTGGGSL